MKALKITAAVILSLLIFTIQASAIIIKALSDSLTPEAISDAVRDSVSAKAEPNLRLKAPVLAIRIGFTGAVSYDEADILSESDIDKISEALGQGDISSALSEIISSKADELGLAPEKAELLTETILNNEEVITFVGEYSSQVIKAALNGDEAPVLSKEKIMELADAVIDELPEELSDGFDRQAAISYIEQIAPKLAEDMNGAVGSAQSSLKKASLRNGALRAAGSAVDGSLFRLLLAADIVFGGLLIILFLKNKKGLVWWAVTSVITAAPFILFKWTAVSAVAGLPRFQNMVGLVKPFLTRCQNYGFILLGFAAVLIIIYLLLTKLKKTKKEGAEA